MKLPVGTVLTWEEKFLPDFRGRFIMIRLAKRNTRITEIGISPDVNWTDVEPIDSEAEWNEDSWEVPFAIFVERKKAEIAQARYNAEIAGNKRHPHGQGESGTNHRCGTKAMQDSTYTCQIGKGIDGFVELLMPRR